ncbi:threonine ammonia-lyase IlvA [Sediminicola luteus]|uniref:L-threonine dehydratase n=1 Tax=Sediminicola luteus TaxID=319238 RepID=A0A2A4G7T5_9FLAO|nr:threonine ammonia-lyase IlvA [Sediminicola luteus]PCE64024.1 threonine dehydratase [Sediminicola luteus]
MKDTQKIYIPSLDAVKAAAQTIAEVADPTPLGLSRRLSRETEAQVWLKREDLQRVRSYKIRGAFNKISSLNEEQLSKGVVCASAGNHAQGVAFACNHLQIQGQIYMPTPTPRQKVEQTQLFGGEFVEVILIGDTYDDAAKAAHEACEKEGKTFVHPFNDPKTIEGQGTIGLELLEQAETPIDFVFVPVGGGGLAAGLSSVFKSLSPETKIIGVEPAGAPSMKMSLRRGEVVQLGSIDKFIDGAAVQKVGELTHAICQQNLHEMLTVPEGKVCQTILDLYNRDAIVVEPAGALTIAALDYYKEQIKGKHVVCIVSGSNNDIARMAEIKERALLYGKLKHYFLIRFPQRPGALREFLTDILGPDDDIAHFEYSKKNSKENAPAVVGIELKRPEDLEPLIQRMKAQNFFGAYLNDEPDLFQYLI